MERHPGEGCNLLFFFESTSCCASWGLAPCHSALSTGLCGSLRHSPVATSSSTGQPVSSATGLPGPSGPSQSSFMLPPSAEGADADCQGSQARVLQGTMPLLCPGVTNHLGAGINNNVIYSMTRALRFSDTKTRKRPAGRWLVRHLASQKPKAKKQLGGENPARLLGPPLGLYMGPPSLGTRQRVPYSQQCPPQAAGPPGCKGC